MRKSVKLGYYDSRWQVISVKNSTDYLPGQILQRHEVDALCNNHKWEVVIVPMHPDGRS